MALNKIQHSNSSHRGVTCEWVVMCVSMKTVMSLRESEKIKNIPHFDDKCTEVYAVIVNWNLDMCSLQTKVQPVDTLVHMEV